MHLEQLSKPKYPAEIGNMRNQRLNYRGKNYYRRQNDQGQQQQGIPKGDYYNIIQFSSIIKNSIKIHILPLDIQIRKPL